LSPTNINIPWYVSREYAVFIPDIEIAPGRPGYSALSTVESSVRYLATNFRWIDRDRIGLQGHSFGGYEVNYMAMNSNLFAAVQSSAGPTDFISSYSTLRNNQSSQEIHEVGQDKLGVPPWDNVMRYIENSPVFSVNKASTPILLMHGTGDDNVNFNQSLEFYLSLRRLKKPVWLLEYQEQGHVLPDQGGEGIDFTIRQQQFFDHYLKSAPAPLWMVEGIPAKYKGIKSGLLLDSLNRRP
jgi:dipeptidyl aminopeptidase/acylaminoacyl peptidase